MNKVCCPICGKEMPGPFQEWPDYPFCSARCRKIDLGRWLSESYRMAADDSSAKPADDSDE